MTEFQKFSSSASTVGITTSAASRSGFIISADGYILTNYPIRRQTISLFQSCLIVLGRTQEPSPFLFSAALPLKKL